MRAVDLVIGNVYGIRIHPKEDPRPVIFEGRTAAQGANQQLEFTDVGSGTKFTRATAHSIAGSWDSMVAKYTRPIPISGTIEEMIDGALDDANFIVKVQELESVAMILATLGITAGIAVVSAFGEGLQLEREPALFIRHQDAAQLTPLISTLQFQEFDELEQRITHENNH